LLFRSPFDAVEAQSMGIVNRVVDDPVLMEEARKLARCVAQQPAGALVATKRLLRSETGSVAVRIEEELESFRQQLGSEEFKAGPGVFGEGSQRLSCPLPVWPSGSRRAYEVIECLFTPSRMSYPSLIRPLLFIRKRSSSGT